jgi:hypothetical protein
VDWVGLQQISHAQRQPNRVNRIEIILLFVCGSVPTLKPLYRLAFGGKAQASTKRGYGIFSGDSGKNVTHYVRSVNDEELRELSGDDGIAVTRNFEVRSEAGSQELVFPQVRY